MSGPLSPMVLGLGALISSPALFAAFVDGTLPVETALVRFAVACLISWVGLAMLDTLLSSTSAPIEDKPALEATQVLPPAEHG